MHADPAVMVAAMVRRSFERFAHRRAALTVDGWISFASLGALVESRAREFASVAAPGDRVVIAMSTSLESRIVELAVLLAGLVRVAVSPRLHPTEVEGIARDCGARLVLTDDGVMDAAATGSPRDDLAMLIYTSGSTGAAKGAMVTHLAWSRHVARTLDHLPALDENDVVLAVAQLPHFGGSMALDCFFGGAATVFLPRFDAGSVLDAVDEHAVTILPLATTMLAQLVDEIERSGRRPASLRAVVYGGSAAPAGLLERAARLLPLHQFYGLAEALAPLTHLDPADHAVPARLASAGRWIPGVEHRFVDGELQVRGEVVMPGYWGAAGAGPAGGTAPATGPDADGWLATGDLAHEGPDGYLFIAERTGNVIISGGFVVHPREVEDVIATLPEIAEVAVVPMPHPRWGQGITAVVVLRTPPGVPGIATPVPSEPGFATPAPASPGRSTPAPAASTSLSADSPNEGHSPDLAAQTPLDATSVRSALVRRGSGRGNPAARGHGGDRPVGSGDGDPAAPGPTARLRRVGDDEQLFAAVVSHCREHLAGYKKPVALYVVDALPRSAAGKVDRRRIIRPLEKES